MTPSDNVFATKHPLTGPLNFTLVERVDKEDKRPKGKLARHVFRNNFCVLGQ
jgi:hypothetical protein